MVIAEEYGEWKKSFPREQEIRKEIKQKNTRKILSKMPKSKKINFERITRFNKTLKAPSFQRVPIKIHQGGYATLMKENILGGVQGQHEGFTSKKDMPRKILSLKNDLF